MQNFQAFSEAESTHEFEFDSLSDYEIRSGKYFIIFDKSRQLDYLPQIVNQEIVEVYYPKRWRHYGLYCQNHIIDIIATKEPRIKKYMR